METSKLFLINEDDALILASIIEMIHCYSLIHDDLPALDNSDFRRGMLSAHKKFGEANALLAGSLLLIVAIEIANKYFSPALVSKINQHIMLMIRGQTIDLISKNHALNCQETLNMYKLKTGSLFALACTIGGIVNNNKEFFYNHLKDFGYNFGILFQISDDLKDVSSGETNILSVLSHAKVAQLVVELKDKCLNSLLPLNLDAFSILFQVVNNI